MWAVVDNNGNIVEDYCYDCGKTRYWIFKKKEEAEKTLKEAIDDIVYDMEIIREQAKVDGNKPEDYEDWDTNLKWKKYYEGCRIVKAKVILEEK